MVSNSLGIKPSGRGSKTGWFKIFLLVIVVAVITSALTVWIMVTYMFPKEFKPVKLSDSETQVLNAKLDQLDSMSRPPLNPEAKKSPPPDEGGAATDASGAEPYSEEDAKREIIFSERELNALVAKNTDLARKLSIDLSENLASAKLLVPLDPEFPFLGGKTLKVTAGLELRYAEKNPVVALRGISIWGVPIPNAWLGGIKKRRPGGRVRRRQGVLAHLRRRRGEYQCPRGPAVHQAQRVATGRVSHSFNPTYSILIYKNYSDNRTNLAYHLIFPTTIYLEPFASSREIKILHGISLP